MRVCLTAVCLVCWGGLAGAQPRDLGEELERIRRANDLPSIAAAAYRNGELVGSGAAGFYSTEHAISVTTGSRYHLGSCTKAMTAAVLASVVEESDLEWDSTLAEALPALEPFIHEAYAGVTVRDLLAHRSGIAESRDAALATIPWTQLAPIAGDPDPVQRIELAKTALAVAPSGRAGEEYVYSNFGYIVAGLVAETWAGRPWEDLLRECVFEPLEMTSAGFGPPGAPRGSFDDEPTEPLGHTMQDEWRPMPVLSGQPLPDNPPVFNPAGRVHASVLDWGRFADDFERGVSGGDGTIFDAAVYEALATDPEGDGYALGWIVAEREWAGGRAFSHAGSNRMWFSLVWVAPERDLSIVVAINAATPAARAAADEAIMKIVKTFTFDPDVIEHISTPPSSSD